MTWIAPDNNVLALVTGGINGLGINPLPTFDWNVISVLYDPIVTPLFALANIAVGARLVAVYVILPIYWKNF
jgi:hypothetical protein